MLTAASVLFNQSPTQATLSRAVLRDLQDPVSPNFHRWLTPDDYAARFGAAKGDVDHVSAWLASQGLSVLGASRTATRLFFTGTVAQIERAFQTEMHEYDVNGEKHFAMAVPPSVPSGLAPVILGLRGVHDFHPRAPRHQPRPSYWWAYPVDGGVDDYLTLAPADWAAIYGVAPLYAQGHTGQGQNIAVLGFSDYNDADILAFRQAFGLDTSNLPTRVLVPESGNAFHDGTVGWFGEAELDLEWSGAVARDAKISFVFTGDSATYDIWDALYYAVDQGGYQVISASYADCEPYYAPIDIRFTQMLGDAAAMQGMTFVAATGDWGAAQCDSGIESAAGAELGYSVAWPASIPSVVGVGGTELNWGAPIPEPLNTVPSATYWEPSDAGYTAKGYIPEMGWNEMALEIQYDSYFWGAGGGGVSVVYPMPYWQVGQVPSGSYRRVPDVALTAAYAQVGYVMSSSWTTADGDSGTPYPEELYPSGGTSAATPSFAGLVAVVNEATGGGGFGNMNPLLYALNASTTGKSGAVFHDITTGNNIVPCQPGTPSCPASAPCQFGYSAGPGYDMVTGLGSVNAANLVAAINTLAPTTTTLQVTPTGSTEGSPVTLKATISSTATSNAMTGAVTFYIGNVFYGMPGISVVSTGTVQSTDVGTEGGSVTVSAVAPPGLDGGSAASIVAFYGGDDHYRASWSAPGSVTATSSFVTVPGQITLRPNQITDLATSGGVAPVTWFTLSDGACDPVTEICSAIEALGPTTAAFQAGPDDGAVWVLAIDADGAEGLVQITVLGKAIDGGSLPIVDAGGKVDSGRDASARTDSGAADARATDASAADARLPDAHLSDGRAADGRAPDASPVDARPRDARTVDATFPDATRTGNADSGGVTSRDSGAHKPGKDAAVAALDAARDGEASGAGGAGSSGCSCTAAGVNQRGERAPWGASLAGCVFGLVALGRRRGVRYRRRC